MLLQQKIGANGILHISAKDLGTGIEQAITVSRDSIGAADSRDCYLPVVSRGVE